MQTSKLRAKSARKGIKRRIALAALNAGLHRQFDKDGDVLRIGNSKYGSYNLMEIINLSDCNLKIELDYNPTRFYIAPASGSMRIDEEIFQSFQIENLAMTTNVDAGDVSVVCSYEMPLERERFVPPVPARSRAPPAVVPTQTKKITQISRWV